MADIDRIELRRVDLTMLLVFLALMRHRKATAVADEMSVTQSTVSHTLGRLRDVFGDPLFLRRPQGLEPTARAVELEPKVAAAVETLRQALRGGDAFEPATAAGRAVIGALDAELATTGVALLRRVRRAAPGLSVSFLSLGRAAALGALDRGEIDLALGFFWQAPPGLVRRDLRRETYLVVGRDGHPQLGEPFGLEAYLAAEHLVVSPGGELEGIVDRHLAEIGCARRVVTSMPLFLPALATVAETDLLATLPATLARRLAPRFGLACRAPPFAIRPFEISALLHPRNDRSGLHRWLLDEVAAAMS